MMRFKRLGINYDAATQERIRGHQFDCYRSILEDKGRNWYKALRFGARTRQSHGLAVVDLKVDRALTTQT